MSESEVQRSPSAQRFLRTNTTSRELSRCPSSTNIKLGTKSECNTPRRTTPQNNDKEKLPRNVSPHSRSKVMSFTQFEQDCLKAHNTYRLGHGVSPLKLNKRLCHFAEDWAKVRRSLHKTDELHHINFISNLNWIFTFHR